VRFIVPVLRLLRRVVRRGSAVLEAPVGRGLVGGRGSAGRWIGAALEGGGRDGGGGRWVSRRRRRSSHAVTPTSSTVPRADRPVTSTPTPTPTPALVSPRRRALPVGGGEREYEALVIHGHGQQVAFRTMHQKDICPTNRLNIHNLSFIIVLYHHMLLPSTSCDQR